MSGFRPSESDRCTGPVDLRQWRAPPLLTEAVILSTCNRVEVYGIIHDETALIEEAIIHFLAKYHNLAPDRFARALTFCYDEMAVEHLFETTAGLQSLVIGEAQIQGQVRKAFLLAQRVRSVGPILSRMFSRALTTGKRVRRETSLGAGAASVSQASIELAERRLGDLEGRKVLLVGSGKMSELAAQNLLAHGATDLIVINRTYERACELASRYAAAAYPFEALQDVLNEADIVISSTSAPHTVITAEHIATALGHRAHRGPTDHTIGASEMLLIDLAVPRDIDEQVAQVAGAHLYTIDDLQEVVGDTMARRGSEVACARTIVQQEVDEFNAWLRTQQVLPVLSSWRQHAEEMRDAELQRAMRRLSELSPEQQHIVEALSRSLVNKLLHMPTLRAKHAAAAGDGERYAEMLRDLWDM
ncbi:MAG: glutamyl-tRNA reductase [Chloroflexaceae bacterium]|nr:glutamyl-tRNA reductase [Chloroflexaceae bacterium]